MHGIHTALVTPFDDTGTVDLPAFSRLCTRQLQAGIHGLVVCGTTGEAATLTLDEQSRLLKRAISLADGRAVTMGVGTNCTRTTVERVEAAAREGADYGLLVFPYYNKPNLDGHRVHVKAALEVGLPLVLYHVPGRTGQRLDPVFLAELANLEGVHAIKEATGDLLYDGELLQHTDTPVLSGDDFTFLPLLALGGTGCISVVSNVDPARTVAIYEHFQAGRLAQARAEMRRLWPLVRYLFSDSNPVPCKAALATLGLCTAEVRAPLARSSDKGALELLKSLGIP